MPEPASEDVLLIRLNRPGVANAINTQMAMDLDAALSGINEVPNRYRCVVITGAGERAFCAGADLKQRNDMTNTQWQAQHVVFENMMTRLLSCPVPVIAAVNGAAYGGGCEIALACDFIYAAANARLALPEVTLGVIPGLGGTQQLPRAAGQRRGLELLLTGQAFSAADGHEWGIVNKVVAPDELLASVMETANTIAANAPVSVRQIKHAVSEGMQHDLQSGMQIEIKAHNQCALTSDRLEGVQAFNEKRKPVFRGE